MIAHWSAEKTCPPSSADPLPLVTLSGISGAGTGG
jgi:hypothetical protein